MTSAKLASRSMPIGFLRANRNRNNPSNRNSNNGFRLALSSAMHVRTHVSRRNRLLSSRDDAVASAKAPTEAICCE